MPKASARSIWARISASAASGVHMRGKSGDGAGEIAFVVDQAGSLRGARERCPPIAGPFAGERKMDAEVERTDPRPPAAQSPGNHGQGTMTEPQVSAPDRESSTKAALAPWHMPTSSACTITARRAGSSPRADMTAVARHHSSRLGIGCARAWSASARPSRAAPPAGAPAEGPSGSAARRRRPSRRSFGTPRACRRPGGRTEADPGLSADRIVGGRPAPAGKTSVAARMRPLAAARVNAGQSTTSARDRSTIAAPSGIRPNSRSDEHAAVLGGHAGQHEDDARRRQHLVERGGRPAPKSRR